MKLTEEHRVTKVVVLKEVQFIIDISNSNTFIVCPARTPVKIQTDHEYTDSNQTNSAFH